MRLIALTAAALTAVGTVRAQAVRAQTVRDSAGIQIVENRTPALAPAKAWRVDPKPTLVIGDPSAMSAGDSLYEFSMVMGVVRMADGRWAVGVQGASTIRFYDATGKFLRSAGRRGRGPGEFLQILMLKPLAGDTLFVSDVGEVEYFTGQGKWVRQGAGRATAPGDHFIFPMAAFDDGAYAGFDWNDATERATNAGERSLPMLIVSRDGTRRDSVGLLPARSILPSTEPVPFAPSPVFAPAGLAVGDGRNLYYGFSARYAISQFSRSGKPVRLIRRQFTPEPVTAEARAAFQQNGLNATGEDGRPLPPAMKERAAARLANRMYASNFPAFGMMLADGGGNLWVRRYDYRESLMKSGPVNVLTLAAPTNWDVFDTRGRWLCTTELPARFTPLDIGSDYVAGVARDADDVEMVRIYKLIKP